MNHLPDAWGRPRDDVYGAYDRSYLQSTGPIKHTQAPVVTGTSVIGVRYSTGIVLATDNLASYGSMARFTDIRRIIRFNDHAILGFGGDVSDMQYIDRLLQSLDTDMKHMDPDTRTQLSARNLHAYLQKVMYHRRSQVDPLWNSILVGGLDDDDKPFLAQVDMYGNSFSAPTLATGFGGHLAQPLLRLVAADEAAVAILSRSDAVAAVRECMKVLWYRDARSSNKYSLAVLDSETGLELKFDQECEDERWQHAEVVRGYGTQTA